MDLFSKVLPEKKIQILFGFIFTQLSSCYENSHSCWHVIKNYTTISTTTTNMFLVMLLLFEFCT